MTAGSQLTALTRIGFAARGVLYIVIAALLITSGQAEDLTGALEHLNDGPARVLLILMTAGFVAYGVWRLSDAALDIEHHGSTRKGWGQRFAAGAVGLIYLWLAWQAVKVLQHAGGGASGGDGKDQAAQKAFQLPGGELLLMAAGLVVAGVGAFQIYKAWKGDFLRHLEAKVSRQAWAQWSGRVGYAARGVIFVVSGYFLLRAGLDQRPSETGGMAEALAWLASPWDILTAIGLLCFGLFSLVGRPFSRIARCASG